MKRVNQYHFYEASSRLHPLSSIQDKAKLSTWAWPLFQARSWLRFLLGGALVELVVSRAAAEELIVAIDRVTPQTYAEFSSIDMERELDWSEA